MQAHFSSQSLAEVFRDLFHAERSGVLHLSRGDVEKRIYFDRGMILFAESSLEDEDLGPRLVNEGKISPGALAEARRNVSEPKDLAQALINRDLIGKEALSHTVRFLVDAVVTDAFRWEGGSCRFSEGWLLQEIFEADVVTTFETILKGIDSMVGFEPIGTALRSLDNAIKVREHPPLPIEMLTLTPSNGFVLSRIDGETSFRDIITTLPDDAGDDPSRFVYGLLVMGVLELVPAVSDGPFRAATILREHADRLAETDLQEKAIVQAYEGMRDNSPFEVLGVPAQATREEIERAYEEAKATFNRDRFTTKVREQYRTELAYIESRLVESYLALIQNIQHESKTRRVESDPEEDDRDDVRADDLLVRVEMDKTKTKKALEASGKAAETYYQKGRKAFREGDFHNAIQYGKLAISYNADDARYYFLVADCQGRNPESRWQRMAEQNLVKATELDPWNPDYWIELGRFYKKRGLSLRARKQFEKALEIAPSHDVATEELKELR